MRDIIENHTYAFLLKPFALGELESLLVRFEDERSDAKGSDRDT
jgi:hypothetical protein